MRVLLASPRGFCAGVDRAIDVVELALELFGAPVYVKHEIVHNRYVVDRLCKLGAVFVEHVAEIPEGSVAVFSAHGSPPEDYAEARTRALRLIDATCPLVTKVHLEARRYAKEGFSILLIGHRGHVELVGTMGEAPGQTIVIQTAEDARTVAVKNPDRVVVLTQTTLSVDDTKEIIAHLRARFPRMISPPSADICYATTNRQRAVKALTEHAGVILVIGSKNSSNSNRLREVATQAGVPAYLIDRAADIDPAWLTGVEVIGVTAGASAPSVLVEEVLAFLSERGASPAEELSTVSENVRFALPEEIVAAAAARGKPLAQLEKHAIQQDMVMEK